MNKFKTLLLTLAGASLIATPLVAAQCNDKKTNDKDDANTAGVDKNDKSQDKPSKDVTDKTPGTNLNDVSKKPDQSKPSDEGKKPVDSKDKEGNKPETKTQDPELAAANLVDGNSLFQLMPNFDKAAVLNHIKNSDNYVQFDHKSREITTNKKNGTSFLQFKPQYSASTVQPVNASKTTFTYKNRDLPNGNLNFVYDETSGLLLIKYKLALKQTDGTFKYTNKAYTSTVKITNETENTNSDNNGTPTSDSDIRPGENDNNVTPINVAANGYNYVYDANNDYYASANGKKGKDLIDELLRIQKSHLKGIHGYGSLPGFYNRSKAFRDLFYENDNTMLDVYSENPSGKDPYTYANYSGGDGRGEGSGMNREHMIPQSWFGKASPMVSDANHIFPTDIKVNGVRSNFAHDYVTSPKVTFKQGSKMGRNNLGLDAMEPLDEFKGDVARAYLYFTATYNDKSLNNMSASIFTRTFPYIKEHYLATYLEWNKNDQVGPWDVLRNNETAAFQEVRNPFIDYPDLANNIFGSDPKPFVNKGILLKAEPINNN
ncbi:endonuclease [Mycoplasma sp. VS292A]|uniref:endonuclease n=1 Tax=Mycoplasma sp. VS292A TaxID=3401680 RepID=UPI003AAE5A61